MNRNVTSYNTDAEWLAARAKCVSTTEVAALFGLSPYQTAFELFHRKRDATLVEPFDSERMKWGRRLQPTIAAGIAEDMRLHIYIDGDRCFAVHPKVDGLGASFDYVVERLDESPSSFAVLEIKNVDGLIFRDEWPKLDSGEYEAPAHIELQLQAQLECLDIESGYIGALVAGNRAVVIERERDREIGAMICQRVAAFWQAIANNTPPKPDYKADAEFIARLCGYAEPGKVLDLAAVVDGPAPRIAELVGAYKAASAAEKTASDAKEAARAEILHLIGDHERVTGDGFVIATPMVAPTTVSFERKGYRSFRITQKKGKK